MSDLFDEIKEDIQKENLTKLWQKYGAYVITFVILCVGATGGAVWYKGAKRGHYGKEGAEFYEAVKAANKGNDNEMLKNFSELKNHGNTNYRFLATLKEAATFVNQQDFANASKRYKELVGTSGVPEELRSYAKLMHVLLSYQDEQSFNEKSLAADLDALAASDSPWKFSAQELLAFHTYNSGDKQLAGELFKGLQEDETAPASVRQRAKEMMEALAVEAPVSPLKTDS